MSWASRRRLLYGGSTLLFFTLLIGVPLGVWLYERPNCFDGKQNQDETAIDKGGPCVLLDERYLQPYATLWSRAFPVRGGLYSAIAYIENPNTKAGVRAIRYRFGLYDEKNVLVAEREGITFIMPGGITPVFEGAINTGNRTVARTYFEITPPLVWERMTNTASIVAVESKRASATQSAPRLEATAENTSVTTVLGPAFVAVLFDPAGNAFAASQTTLARLAGGEREEIVFTWPDPFQRTVGRIDIVPLLPPSVSPH